MLLAIGCTFLSWVTCFASFEVMAANFQPYRNARTEFAFHWLPIAALAWLAFLGFIVLMSGKTVLPAILGLIVLPIFDQAFSWSGPDSEFREVARPLLQIQGSLLLALFVINMVLLILCVRRLRNNGAHSSRNGATSPASPLAHF